jgi:hypothetical protein
VAGIFKKRNTKTDDGALTIRVKKNKKLFVAEVETKAGMRYSATHEEARQAEHEAFRLYVETKYGHLDVAENQKALQKRADELKSKLKITKT